MVAKGHAFHATFNVHRGFSDINLDLGPLGPSSRESTVSGPPMPRRDENTAPVLESVLRTLSATVRANTHVCSVGHPFPSPTPHPPTPPLISTYCKPPLASCSNTQARHTPLIKHSVSTTSGQGGEYTRSFLFPPISHCLASSSPSFGRKIGAVAT